MKYTVFCYRVILISYQVQAKTEEDAKAKADKLYRRRFELPLYDVQEGWLTESAGEDK